MSIPHDRFAHLNPAFGAACLHWLADGYEQEAGGRTDAPRLISPVWAIFGLALLSPKLIREQLPKNANGRITLLLHDHPDWKYSLPEAMKSWASAFWDSVRLGVATGTLTLEESRLRALGIVQRPASEPERDLRRRALALGKALAKEGPDSAVLLAIGITIEL